MNTIKIIILSFIFIFFFDVYTIAQTWNIVGDSTDIINFDSVTPGGVVYVIKQIDSLLYIGGGFRNVGKMKVMGIATWNGAKWDSLGPGTYSAAFDVCKFNDSIYLGAGGGWVVFDGNSWVPVGTGLSTGDVKALKYYQDKLYLGCHGAVLNSVNLHNIASWDGTSYAGLNGGVVGAFEGINALTVFNDELIAGGEFNYAGGNYAFNVAAWGGNNWHALDTGTSAYVKALVVDTINNFLYVGGGFTSAGGYDGVNASTIARWDGYQWDSLGPYPVFCDAMTLCMYHNILYRGFCVSGDTMPYSFFLAKWDGKQWTPIYGPNCTVTALGVYQDELYVGGCFTKIYNDSIYGIARYYEPPDTICDYLQAIIQPQNLVLHISDSTTVHFYNNILHASSWYWDFGDGGTDTIRIPVHTYSGTGVYNVSVIVTYQNCTDTAYTAITIIDDTGINNSVTNTTYLGQNIPNPFNNTTTISYLVPQGTSGLLHITDSRGQLIKEFNLYQGSNKLTLSLDNLKTGVYFYSIFIDGMKKETKTMILK